MNWRSKSNGTNRNYYESVPFRSDTDLREHFSHHVGEFPNIKTETEYLARAEAFLNGPRASTTLECRRPQGGYARYDTVTQEYGSVRRDGSIATYFIPDPTVHLKGSNLEYYNCKCR